MKTYKTIILGPQCAGKTTLKKYLVKERGDLPLVEEDEMFTDLNNGEYPFDIEYKEKILRPRLEDMIRQSNNLIFLTSYCSVPLLTELKPKGFRVAQLILERGEFQRRNTARMKEGYADANTWANEVFGFHQEVRDKGLIDLEINASQPIETIAKEVLYFMED